MALRGRTLAYTLLPFSFCECLRFFWEESSGAAYFAGANECDFVVLEKGGVVQAIQVCHELTDDNRRRELGGVRAAMTRFGIKRGLIITRRQEENIRIDAGEVSVLPAWKWSLGGRVR